MKSSNDKSIKSFSPKILNSLESILDSLFNDVSRFYDN